MLQSVLYCALEYRKVNVKRCLIALHLKKKNVLLFYLLDRKSCKRASSLNKMGLGHEKRQMLFICGNSSGCNTNSRGKPLLQQTMPVHASSNFSYYKMLPTSTLIKASFKIQNCPQAIKYKNNHQSFFFNLTFFSFAFVIFAELQYIIDCNLLT